MSTGSVTFNRPDFSLVVATYGEGQALERLLDSLVAQRGSSIEVIVVDQNSTDDVRLICNRYASDLDLHRLTSLPGLSRARNVGIARCTGRIIAFPDDDCWYPADLLSALKKEILGEKGWAGVTCRCTDEQGRLAAGGDSRREGMITKHNVWHRGVSATLFLRAEVVARAGLFDETLGLGSDGYFKSGEETDYILRVLLLRERMIYLPHLRVFHPLPPPSRSAGAIARSWSYGLGFGRVLHKHNYGMPAVAYHIAYPLLGAAAAMMRWNLALAKLRLARVIGRIQGWRWRAGETIAQYSWIRR
jgi:glycosyltransferase involved in cell wall biosynthesis